MTKSTKVTKMKKQRGKHSSPQTSGVQNLPKSYIEKRVGSGGGRMEEIMGLLEKGMKNTKEYQGLWTDEELTQEIHDYFTYVVEKDIKPAKVGLRLWLGLSKSQYYDWETKPQVYGYKSNLIQMANDFMEMQYISQIESYPTGNIFLLKSSHQHVDKQEVNITNVAEVDRNNILDTVTKLGLNEGTD